MSQLNQKLVIIDSSGDLHRGILSNVSKSKLRVMILGLLADTANEASKQAEVPDASTIISIMRQKVEEL